MARGFLYTKLEKKECKECGVIKFFTPEFFPYSEGIGTPLRYTCRPCYYQDQRLRTKLRKENPVPKNYACPICGITEEKSKYKIKWCVDHDHITFEFRGMLCDSCNRVLGTNTDESIVFFERAIEYLKKEIK